MSTVTVPLVATYLRPPARGILAALPAGAELRLERERENPHDPNAVRVLVNIRKVFKQDEELQQRLEAEVGPYGYNLYNMFSRDEWTLGYVARENPPRVPHGDATLVESGIFAESESVSGRIVFDQSGKPAIEVVVAR